MACNHGYYTSLKNKMMQYYIDLPTARETIEFQNFRKELVYKSVILDPLFWECLGKAKNWGTTEKTGPKTWYWKANVLEKWHRMIDHLAEGGTIESFFETL